MAAGDHRHHGRHDHACGSIFDESLPFGVMNRGIGPVLAYLLCLWGSLSFIVADVFKQKARQTGSVYETEKFEISAATLPVARFPLPRRKGSELTTVGHVVNAVRQEATQLSALSPPPLFSDDRAFVVTDWTASGATD